MGGGDIQTIIAKVRAGSGLTAEEARLLVAHIEVTVPSALARAELPGPDIRTISPDVNVSGVYGAGDVEITGFRCCGSDGIERTHFRAGEEASFALDYRIRRPDLKEHCDILIAFKQPHRDAMRTRCNTLLLDQRVKPEGTITARFDALPLGTGRYSIAVMVTKEGYFSEYQTQFFSIHPGVYFAQSGIANIVVEPGDGIFEEAGVVLKAASRLE